MQVCIKSVPLFVVALAVLIGCRGNGQLQNELRSAKAELRELREQREQLEASAKSAHEALNETHQMYLGKIEALQEEIRKIQEYKRLHDRLSSAYDVLEGRLSRFESWSDDLIDSIGPAIYTPSVHDWPLYGRRPEEATVSGIIRELNEPRRSTGMPLLMFKKTDSGTVFVEVENARKLSREMGSAGARGYMQSVIYSLTSLEEVNCVDFEFEEGDHAVPGKYCR